MHQLRVRRLAVLVVGLALLASAAHALSTKLNVVEVPENSLTVDFKASPGGPAWALKAELNYRHGQTLIEIHTSGKHQPAVLYGGDVTCYVLWAIEQDGIAANLGEIRVTGDNESHHFRTPVKRFALVVTAEPYGLVSRPSELVVFTNDSPKRADVKTVTMTFDSFAKAPAHTQKSITTLEYKKTEPIDLIEAREAYALAGRNDAKTYAADLYAQAGAELKRAEELNKKGDHGDKFEGASRGSVDASAQAIHIATSAKAADALAKEVAARKAKVAALEERSEHDELIIARLEDIQDDLEIEVGILSEELQDALATIVETRLDAAAVVLTLPEVMFTTGQAKLTPAGEIALAKLAGIMLVFPQVGADVRGYTDSTGTLATNMDLSLRRAEAAATFLASQGVDPGRMTAEGLGPEDPIADNSTPAGRALNRRVEIELGGG